MGAHGLLSKYRPNLPLLPTNPSIVPFKTFTETNWEALQQTSPKRPPELQIATPGLLIFAFLLFPRLKKITNTAAFSIGKASG